MAKSMSKISNEILNIMMEPQRKTCEVQVLKEYKKHLGIQEYNDLTRFNSYLTVTSDEAGQFNIVLNNGLSFSGVLHWDVRFIIDDLPELKFQLEALNRLYKDRKTLSAYFARLFTKAATGDTIIASLPHYLQQRLNLTYSPSQVNHSLIQQDMTDLMNEHLVTNTLMIM